MSLKLPVLRNCTAASSTVIPFSGQWRTEGGIGVLNPPPPKLRRPSKIVPNSTRLWKLLKSAEFRMPTLQDVWKKGSEILKLPSVRNCFTLAMTNKLVAIINSLKVPKIKKLLQHEIKFLVSNYSCLQNPWLGGRGLPPPDPCSLSTVLNWIHWTPPKKISGYTTVSGTPCFPHYKLILNYTLRYEAGSRMTPANA